MRLSAPPTAGEDAARSKRARIAEVVFAAVVLLLALAGHAAANAAQADGGAGRRAAVVSRDGAVIDTIDLGAVNAPYELRLEDARGANVVRVEPGRIRITEADCPDEVCVHAGWIDRPGAPIACVPHGLTIVVERLTESGKEAADGVDATSR